jgi:hypothetical protein
MLLKTGDTISCRIKSSLIVSPHNAYDEIKSFVIVAVDEHGYYLFIPHYFYLKDSFTLDISKCKKLDIQQKYLCEEIIYIQENMVAFIESVLDGMNCKICKEYFPYAVANQNNGSLVCYTCKSNPYR